MSTRYGVVVLGAGPGGYTAAGLPDDVKSATKRALALQALRLAILAASPARFVTPALTQAALTCFFTVSDVRQRAVAIS